LENRRKRRKARPRSQHNSTKNLRHTNTDNQVTVDASPITDQKPANKAHSSYATPVSNPPIARSAKTFARKHWEAIVTTIASVAAVATLIVATFTWLAPNPAPLVPARISITSVGVNRVVDMKFDQVDADMNHVAVTDKESVVDVEFKNEGGVSGLAQSITANFDYASELENCNPGAGDLIVTGSYNIRVPLQPPRVPFRRQADRVAFQILSYQRDRLGIMIGPEKTLSGDYPWLYSLTLSIGLDSGVSLPSPRVGFVSPGGSNVTSAIQDAEHATPDAMPCLQRNAAQLSRVAALGGQLSPSISKLLGEYQSVIHRLTD
jgi:hypothetical protein